MPRLPTGTVTFLFSDIEGSTALLQHLGDRYADVLADHRQLLRAAFQASGGHEVDTAGDGFFVAFPRATDAAARACIEESLALKRELGDERGVARALYDLGMVAQSQGDGRGSIAARPQASRRGGCAPGETRPTLAPSLQVRLERTLELMRSAVHGEEAAATWSEGQAMTLEQAMAYARTVDVETPAASAPQQCI
jgi:hypothetical protein